MVTLPCPWCEHELAVTDRATVEPSMRCDECATVVDLAPAPGDAPVVVMPLAA